MALERDLRAAALRHTDAMVDRRINLMRQQLDPGWATPEQMAKREMVPDFGLQGTRPAQDVPEGDR